MSSDRIRLRAVEGPRKARAREVQQGDVGCEQDAGDTFSESSNDLNEDLFGGEVDGSGCE